MLHRFTAVLCGPVRTRTLVYNPFLMGEVQNARKLLEENQGSQTTQTIVNKFRHSSLPDVLEGKEADWKNWLENLTMTPVEVPKFSDPEDYEAFVNKNHLLLTEIFSPSWDRTLGGARNLLIGGIQMKGCGLTLPPPVYNHVNGSGVCALSLALKAFIFSGLMDSTIPLGSNRSISVQWVHWGSENRPLGIYLRELKVLRMIQVGPELSQEEVSNLREEINSQLGINSAREFFELITSQLAAMVVIGVRANCSPDNILINGHFLDEETWFWPKDLGSMRIYFESEGQGSFDWEKEVNFSTSTFLLLRNAIYHVHKFAQFIFNPKEFPPVSDVEEMFHSHIRVAIPEWDPRTLWKEGLELSENFTTEKFRAWLKNLENDGWSHEVEHFKDKGFGLNLTKPRTKSSGLAERFNSQGRPDFWKIAVKLSKLDSEKTDPEDLNNMLQRFIGASGFVLPFRFVRGQGIVKNTFGLSEFLGLTFEKWPQLKDKIMDLTVWDGNTEVIYPEVKSTTKLVNDCVPLSFTVRGFGDKDCVLPCLKTILRSAI